MTRVYCDVDWQEERYGIHCEFERFLGECEYSPLFKTFDEFDKRVVEIMRNPKIVFFDRQIKIKYISLSHYKDGKRYDITTNFPFRINR